MQLDNFALLSGTNSIDFKYIVIKLVTCLIITYNYMYTIAVIFLNHTNYYNYYDLKGFYHLFILNTTHVISILRHTIKYQYMCRVILLAAFIVVATQKRGFPRTS